MPGATSPLGLEVILKFFNIIFQVQYLQFGFWFHCVFSMYFSLKLLFLCIVKLRTVRIFRLFKFWKVMLSILGITVIYFRNKWGGFLGINAIFLFSIALYMTQNVKMNVYNIYYLLMVNLPNIVMKNLRYYKQA